MRVIRIFTLYYLMIFNLTGCFSQTHNHSVTKGWAKCENKINLDKAIIPKITHFQINKSDTLLTIDFLDSTITDEEMGHFMEVINCLNENYVQSFPDSVMILHFFSKNQKLSALKENQELIKKYVEYHKLRDKIVIMSGTNEAQH